MSKKVSDKTCMDQSQEHSPTSASTARGEFGMKEFQTMRSVMLCHMLLPEITGRRWCLRCGSALGQRSHRWVYQFPQFSLSEPHVVPA